MIKRFKEFNESNESNETLRIFDFDDTLVNSPSFEELAIEFLKEDLSIGDMLKTSVGRIGVNLRDLKWENGRIYVNDPKDEIKDVNKSTIAPIPVINILYVKILYIKNYLIYTLQ